MSELFGLWLPVAQVEVGQELTGTLLFPDPSAPRLETMKQCTVIARARLHGSGNTTTVEAGRWVPVVGPPTRREYTFTFVVPPAGPVSWAGRHVKVTWEVTAELDIPWAPDPKRALEFQVVPRGAL